MKKYLTVLSLALWVFAQHSFAAETKVTKHFIEVGTIKYFRGKAENVSIGAYGEKKDPIGPDAYLAIQNRVKTEHLTSRVRYATTANINFANTNKADVEVNGTLKVFGVGVKVAESMSFEKAKSGHLKLVKFFIDEGPLQAMLNKDADGARNYMADEGDDARIVSEVWVVMEAELADHFDSSASRSVAVSLGGNSLDFSASGGKLGSQTITLSQGTVFAYLMHKVKDWNKGKTQIEDMEDDQKGMN
jgi:hypothetical protein